MAALAENAAGAARGTPPATGRGCCCAAAALLPGGGGTRRTDGAGVAPRLPAAGAAAPPPTAAAAPPPPPGLGSWLPPRTASTTGAAPAPAAIGAGCAAATEPPMKVTFDPVSSRTPRWTETSRTMIWTGTVRARHTARTQRDNSDGAPAAARPSTRLGPHGRVEWQRRHPAESVSGAAHPNVSAAGSPAARNASALDSGDHAAVPVGQRQHEAPARPVLLATSASGEARVLARLDLPQR